MLVHHRLIAAGMALATGLSGLATTVPGRTAPPSTARPAVLHTAPRHVPVAAKVAAGWLGRHFQPDGNLPAAEGEPGIDYLPLGIVALVSAQAGSTQIRTGIRFLESHFESYVRVQATRTSTVDAPGRLAQVILAAVAAKADPRAFGGTAPANDLVARLLATQTHTGWDTGLFGSPAAPTYSSAYTQGLALLALAAAGAPNRAGAAWLLRQQCYAGGWMSDRGTPAVCPVPNAAKHEGPDTNSTALAVEGLLATGVSPRHDPLPFFRRSQYPTGGFGYYGAASAAQTPDPDSTAVVAQALEALGALFATRRDGHNALTGLAAFRIGCRAPAYARGAYQFPGAAGPNLYATIQAIPAAAEVPYPVKPGPASVKLPPLPAAC